jgi:hypothetical protein
MSENWDFYFCRVNDALSSIFVDLGIRAAAPDPVRPHLLWLWVPMLSPREDGLSSDVEAPMLHAIEDAIGPALARRNDAILVGRITGAKRREFYFYARDARGFAETVREVFASFPNYAPESGEQLDMQWNQYLGLLFPSARQLEHIKNRQVIAALAKANDSLHTVRPIAHWVYFKHASDRDEVARTLVANGFRASLASDPPQPTSFPAGLRLERDDRAEQDAVDSSVFAILDAIDGLDATYDGWESPVVR